MNNINLNYPINIIGDVHGRVDDYLNIINNKPSSIVLGDFGFKKKHDLFKSYNKSNNHKILFGNHDYYPYLNHDYSLKNYTIINNKIMAIRGAKSTDSHLRTYGLDLFENEELSYIEMDNIIDIYNKVKPEIVLSHDCPMIVTKELFGIENNTPTGSFFNYLLKIHKPKKWIFGHYHEDKTMIYNNIEFICLNELSVYHLN